MSCKPKPGSGLEVEFWDGLGWAGLGWTVLWCVVDNLSIVLDPEFCPPNTFGLEPDFWPETWYLARNRILGLEPFFGLEPGILA